MNPTTDNEIFVLFDKEFITFQSISFIKKFPNLIVTYRETNKIVAIGETKEEISKLNPKLWMEEKDKVVFKSIYDQKQFNPDDIALSIWFILSTIYKRKKDIKKLICNLEIPNYELQSEETQKYFEYTIQSTLRFRKLSINGVTSPLDGGKLRFATNSLEYSRWLMYALSLYLIVINVDFLSKKLGFFFLLVLVLGMAISVWVTEALWLILMQSILSKDFLRLIFQQGYGTGGWSTSKTLANLILGKK